MQIRSILIAASMLAAAPALAQKPAAAPPAPPPSPAAERAAIAFAEGRGRLLYGLDRAAWVATDDFVALMPDFEAQGARGYIVERAGDGFTVTFYGGPADALVAFYRGDVRDHSMSGREVFPPSARPALTAGQRRLVAARDAAATAARGRPCGNRPFNSAVVPPAAADEPIDVYLMTPQASRDQWPMGGHYRLTIAADGSVSNERAFTNTCLVVSGGPVPPGATPVGMGVTHLLDPVPTEIHVFTALAARFPLFVGISDPPRTYEVTGEGIRLVRR